MNGVKYRLTTLHRANVHCCQIVVVVVVMVMVMVMMMMMMMMIMETTMFLNLTVKLNEDPKYLEMLSRNYRCYE